MVMCVCVCLCKYVKHYDTIIIRLCCFPKTEFDLVPAWSPRAAVFPLRKCIFSVAATFSAAQLGFLCCNFFPASDGFFPASDPAAVSFFPAASRMFFSAENQFFCCCEMFFLAPLDFSRCESGFFFCVFPCCQKI